MSANLDLVRSIYAAIGHGDYRAADWADPEIEYVRADGVEPGSVTGLDGLIQAMRDLFGAFEELRAEAEEYRHLHDDRVLVFTTFSARGKASGVHIGHSGAEVFEIHNHKVTRIIVYMDRDRALADLGLEG